MKSEEEKNLIDLINNDKDKLWYTIPDLARLSNMEPEKIVAVIRNSDEFIKSSHLSEDNLAQYTTRKDYEKNVSFYSKLKGAFRNSPD